jgi:hypothetical protein
MVPPPARKESLRKEQLVCQLRRNENDANFSIAEARILSHIAMIIRGGYGWLEGRAEPLQIKSRRFRGLVRSSIKCS